MNQTNLGQVLERQLAEGLSTKNLSLVVDTLSTAKTNLTNRELGRWDRQGLSIIARRFISEVYAFGDGKIELPTIDGKVVIAASQITPTAGALPMAIITWNFEGGQTIGFAYWQALHFSQTGTIATLKPRSFITELTLLGIDCLNIILCAVALFLFFFLNEYELISQREMVIGIMAAAAVIGISKLLGIWHILIQYPLKIWVVQQDLT